MLKTILVLWALSYLTGVCKGLRSLCQHKKCLGYLTDFLATYTQGPKHSRPDRSVYINELNNLLRNYPHIKTLISYPNLSYSDSDEETYEKAHYIFTKLQMQTNEARITLRQSFFPFFSLKQIVLLPVEVLKSLGYELHRTSAFWVTAAAQAIMYLLDMFQPEIKHQLLLMFEHFPKG